MQLLLATCLFEIKIFVNMLMLRLSPINEDPNNPSMCTKQEQNVSYKTFIMLCTTLNPSGPLTGL